MLVDAKYSGYSIIGILYEAGFNSKQHLTQRSKNKADIHPKNLRI